MGNTCFADDFDPEQLEKFQVVDFKEPISKGWKLASVDDVKENLLPAKYILLNESEWIICKLQDGSIKGSGFGFAVDIYYDKGWKSKLIMKEELPHEIKPKNKERPTKDTRPAQKEKAPPRRVKVLKGKDDREGEKARGDKEENPAQKGRDVQQKVKKSPQKEKDAAQKGDQPPQKNNLDDEKQDSPEKGKKVREKEMTPPQKERISPKKKKTSLGKEQASVQKENNDKTDKDKLPLQKKENLSQKENSPMHNKKLPPQEVKLSPQKKKILQQEDKGLPPIKKYTRQEESMTSLNASGRSTPVSDAPSPRSPRSRSYSDMPRSTTSLELSRSRSPTEDSECERASQLSSEDFQKRRNGKEIPKKEAGSPQKGRSYGRERQLPKVDVKTPQSHRANVEKPYVIPRSKTRDKSNELIPDERPKTSPGKGRRKGDRDNRSHEGSASSIVDLILKEGRKKSPAKRAKTASPKKTSGKEMNNNEIPKVSPKKEKSEKEVATNDRHHNCVSRTADKGKEFSDSPRKNKPDKGKVFDRKPMTSVSKQKSQNERTSNSRPKGAVSNEMHKVPHRNDKPDVGVVFNDRRVSRTSLIEEPSEPPRTPTGRERPENGKVFNDSMRKDKPDTGKLLNERPMTCVSKHASKRTLPSRTISVDVHKVPHRNEETAVGVILNDRRPITPIEKETLENEKVFNEQPTTGVSRQKTQSERTSNSRPKTAFSNEVHKIPHGADDDERDVIFNDRHKNCVTKTSDKEETFQSPRLPTAKENPVNKNVFTGRPMTSVSKQKPQNEGTFNSRPKTSVSRGKSGVPSGGQYWDTDETEEERDGKSSKTHAERWKFNEISEKSSETWNSNKLVKKKVAPQGNYKGVTMPQRPVSAFLLKAPESDQVGWKLHKKIQRGQGGSTSLDETTSESKKKKESKEPKRFVKYWPSDIDRISSGRTAVGNTDSVFLRVQR